MDTSDLSTLSTTQRQRVNSEVFICPLPTLGAIDQYHLLHGDKNDFAPGQPAALQLSACVAAALVEGGDAGRPAPGG